MSLRISKFLKNWVSENRYRLISFGIIFLAIFIPILSFSSLSLKITDQLQITSSENYQFNPIGIYENEHQHFFWVERDEVNRFTIQHMYNSETQNLTE